MLQIFPFLIENVFTTKFANHYLMKTCHFPKNVNENHLDFAKLIFWKKSWLKHYFEPFLSKLFVFEYMQDIKYVSFCLFFPSFN